MEFPEEEEDYDYDSHGFDEDGYRTDSDSTLSTREDIYEQEDFDEQENSPQNQYDSPDCDVNYNNNEVSADDDDVGSDWSTSNKSDLRLEEECGDMVWTPVKRNQVIMQNVQPPHPILYYSPIILYKSTSYNYNYNQNLQSPWPSCSPSVFKSNFYSHHLRNCKRCQSRLNVKSFGQTGKFNCSQDETMIRSKVQTPKKPLQQSSEPINNNMDWSPLVANFKQALRLK